MTVNLSDVPEEILHHIFRYLHEKEIFWNVGFTCLYLQHAVLNFIKTISIELHSNNQYSGSHGTKQNGLVGARKGYTQNMATILNNEMITSRISYVVIGKIFNTFYEEQIVEEIEQNKLQFCSKSINGFSTKVLFKKYYNFEFNC